MKNHFAVSLLIHELFVLSCVAPSGVLLAQEGQLTMRQYVAGQAWTEIMLRTASLPTPVATGAIQLERVVGTSNGLDLWRATLPSDHSHPYLLATMDGEVVRLGGFANPELGVVALGRSLGEVNAEKVRTLSEELALLADPNGALQWVYVGKADGPGYASTVSSAWRKIMPRNWPRDTVVATAGGWLTRLTLLSRDTRSYTLHWVPLAFSFEFDRKGRLMAWAERAGESFGVANVPVPPSKIGNEP